MRIKLPAVAAAVGMWATPQRCPSAASYPQPSRRAHRSCRRAKPSSACGCSTPGAGARCCRTGFANAHGTVFRELLYSWHPWCGLQVAVHEAINKPDGVAFRCTLTGSGGDRGLEVPAWMFDRATCPDQTRLTVQPSTSLIALSALAELLRAKSPNAPPPGASSSSHEQIRREGHGTD